MEHCPLAAFCVSHSPDFVFWHRLQVLGWD